MKEMVGAARAIGVQTVIHSDGHVHGLTQRENPLQKLQLNRGKTRIAVQDHHTPGQLSGLPCHPSQHLQHFLLGDKIPFQVIKKSLVQHRDIFQLIIQLRLIFRIVQHKVHILFCDLILLQL